MAKHTFILSEESVNAYGFKVRTSGIDVSEFKKNPVMLFNHNSDLVIGHWENIRFEGTQLKADAVFDEDDEFAMGIEKKVAKGIIKGCSIGYRILRYETGRDRNEADIVTESLLKECSPTALYANKNALRLYDENGNVLNETEVLSYLSINKPQPPLPTMKEFKMTLALLGLLVLSADSTPEQIEQRLTELIQENAKLKAENKTLKDQAEASNASRVKALIDGAITAKKITEGQRSEYTELATSNYDSTKKVLDAIAPVKLLASQLKEGNEGGSGALDKNRDEWTYHDWATKDSRGLEKLSQSDPVKFQQLQDDVVSEVRNNISIGV